jgi:tripartite-type tricarboxylate transporter receptor subunit TctC
MVSKLDRRATLAGLASSAVLPSLARAAWPEHTITIVHGFAAGGNADVVSRIVADALTRRMGVQFIVEAKPGAGGTLAAGYIARATPDGHTLGVLPGGHSVAAAMYKQLNYRSVDDFVMISMLTDFPFLLATYADHPVKDMPGLIAYGRQAAEPLLWASAGNGTGQHLSGELLASMAHIPMKHVPYRGGSEAISDLLGKRLDLVVDTPTVLLAQIKAGQLRALGVTGARRFFALPDTPTIAEGGVPGYETSSWLGLVGPAGLPDDIAAKLNAGVAAVLADADVAANLRNLGSIPTPTSGAVFKARVESDIVKWTRVVADAKIERI